MTEVVGLVALFYVTGAVGSAAANYEGIATDVKRRDWSNIRKDALFVFGWPLIVCVVIALIPSMVWDAVKGESDG